MKLDGDKLLADLGLHLSVGEKLLSDNESGVICDPELRGKIHCMKSVIEIIKSGNYTIKEDKQL